MDQKTLDLIVGVVTQWSERKPDVLALGLAGSWARGDQRMDSDIDFILLVGDPISFKDDGQWLSEIDWMSIGLTIGDWKDEIWGAVWCRRVTATPFVEIEFNFAAVSWASISPIDEGTRRVVSDALRILTDKRGHLTQLCKMIR